MYRTYPLNDPRLGAHLLPRPGTTHVHHPGSSESIHGNRGMLAVPGDPDPGLRLLERLPVANKGTGVQVEVAPANNFCL